MVRRSQTELKVQTGQRLTKAEPVGRRNPVESREGGAKTEIMFFQQATVEYWIQRLEAKPGDPLELVA